MSSRNRTSSQDNLLASFTNGGKFHLDLAHFACLCSLKPTLARSLARKSFPVECAVVWSACHCCLWGASASSQGFFMLHTYPNLLLHSNKASRAILYTVQLQLLSTTDQLLECHIANACTESETHVFTLKTFVRSHWQAVPVTSSVTCQTGTHSFSAHSEYHPFTHPFTHVLARLSACSVITHRVTSHV